MRIILVLALGDLEDMMGSMRRDQATNGVFRQVGIDSVEEYGDVVGIGRQVSQRGILLALIPRDGGFRVCSNCTIIN